VLNQDQARLASGAAIRLYAPMGDRLVSAPASATAH